MNKRQRKKNYKKRHGANPPTKKQAEAICQPRTLRKVAAVVMDFFKSMHEAFENIRTMPDAEFEERMQRLTLEERALALKIRNRGKEPTNGESGKTERLTGAYKGRYGIKTPEGIMSAYEIATGNAMVESLIDFQGGIDRLADYENTGLTPGQIVEIDRLYAEKCKEVATLRGE